MYDISPAFSYSLKTNTLFAFERQFFIPEIQITQKAAAISDNNKPAIQRQLCFFMLLF